MIIRRRLWKQKMRGRHLFLLAFIAVLGLGGLAGYRIYVHAEGDNNFNRMIDGTDWRFSSESPDPNLTWTYDNSNPGRYNSTIEHVLKNESSSNVRFTKLKLYYDAPPAQVQFRVNENYCNFQMPFNGSDPHQLIVRIRPNGTGGWTDIYRKSATREGRYVKTGVNGGNPFTYIRERKYNFSTQISTSFPGDSGAYNYRLTQVAGWGPEAVGSGIPIPSQICQPDPPAVNFAVKDYVEGCSNLLRNNFSRASSSKRVCDFNGSENFYDEDFKDSGTATWYETFDDPGNSCPDGSCTFNGRVFTLPGSFARLDSVTGKYVAEVELELTGPRNLDNDIRQQIRFTLTSTNGGAFGYRVANNGREFGLGAKVGTVDAGNPKGVKLAIPFALPCDAAPANQSGDITVYDADTTQFGPTYVTIFQRNPGETAVPLTGGITPLSNIGQNYGVGVRVADNVSGESASFRINTLQPGKQYMAVVYNPKQAGMGSPERNVFSVRVPYESAGGLIDCRFDLTPSIDTVTPTFEYYPSIATRGVITNVSGRAPGGDHDWQVTRTTFSSRPSNMHGSLADNAFSPCAHMANGNGSLATNCTNMSSTLNYPSTGTYNGTFNDSTEYPVGTYVCFMTSIRRPTWQTTNSDWRHSNMTCSVAGIAPKFQVWGGDMRTQGTAQGSLSVVNGRTYGSWGEYGVFANGPVLRVASGANLAEGRTGTMANWSTLTFANTPSLGGFGSVFPVPTIDCNSAGVECYSGTHTISSNIEHNATYSSINSIPRRIIIADNIEIAPNVDQIDAWLISRGNLNTCNTPGTLRAGMCGNQLRINGPVYANTIQLRRTAGSRTGDLGQSAEVFNLRPTIFLSSFSGDGNDPQAVTDRVKELPPRF